MKKGFAAVLFFSSLFNLLEIGFSHAGAMGPDSSNPNWSGFYAGGNLGGVWGQYYVPISGSNTDPGTYLTTYRINAGSFTGGGQVGYAWQQNSNFVTGIELSANGLSLNSTHLFEQTNLPYSSLNNFTSKADVEMTLMGRLAYAKDNWIAYALGGASVANVMFSADFVPVSVNGVYYAASEDKSNQTLIGAGAGLGIEFAVYTNLTVGVEGRFISYREKEYSLGNNTVFVSANGYEFIPSTAKVHLRTATALLKINYHFGKDYL